MSYQYPFIPGHSSMPATPQTSYRWEDNQQQQRLEQQTLQHPLQHQPEQTDTSSTSTIVHLQQQPDSGRPGSSHLTEGDDPQLRLQHVSVPALLQPEHMRPPMIDTNRVYHVGTSASPPSGPPSAGPSGAYHGAIGPVRAHISPVHTHPRSTAHPYRRPESAHISPVHTNSRGATHLFRRPESAAGVVIARSRREPEDLQSVRQASSSSTSVQAPLSATAMTTPRAFPIAAARMTSTFKGIINPGYSMSGINLLIRTDLHYDSETNVLTALCELPGVSKSDVSIVLSTNAVNGVKQVVVTAKPTQDIANNGYVLRERKSGSASRTFVVPSGTTPDDITAEMHDGLLSLKIQFPPPSSQDDSQEIVIR